MPDHLDQYRAMTPEQLTEEALLIEDQMRGLLLDEGGEPRENVKQSEQNRVDELMRKRTFIRNRIEQHNQAQRAFKSGGGRNLATPYPPHWGRGGQDIDGAEVLHMRGTQARDAALRLLADNKQLAPDQLDRTEKLIRGDHTDEDREQSYVAKRTLLTETAAYRSGWQRLMTDPRPLLNVEEVEALRAFEKFERYESRAMGEVTPSAGGFGVPVFIDASIIMTAQGSGNPFLALAKIAEVTTNVWKGVTSAGVSWSFDTEGSAVSDDSPTLAQPSIIVHMPRGFLPYSIEVGMDYPDFAMEMATLLAEGYDELLVDKFSRGSGSGEPMGLITALDADTNVEVLLTTAGAFGDADVYNVWKALPARFRRKASWMMSVGVNNAIRRMGTSSLSHAYTTNLVGETIDQMFRRQVAESTYFPDLVNTTGHFNQVVVGDFGNYQIARRAGMNTELVPTLFDVTNNRPTGQRGWFAWARIGAGVSNNQGFRLLNQT